MRALTYDGPYRLKVRSKPEPQIEHPQDGIVRVTAAAICGSDLHLLHGLIPDTRIGFTLGHEIVGVVEELGTDAEGVRRGDRVAIPFQIFCGGLLLLLARAHRLLREHQSSDGCGDWHLRVLAHHGRLRRRAGGVRTSAVHRRGRREDP
jgi:threonine dehydrogenase-like Zn-dependent dehydrogenase